MKKYYYFPKSYETDIREKEDAWLENKPQGYIITIGEYKKSNNIKQIVNTTVYNKTILGDITYIPNGRFEENNEYVELIGFCLEADLDFFAPEWQAIINTYSDVLQFEKANDYLNYINNL